MDYNYIGNSIHLQINDFNIAQTLESGQCFRHKKITENHYTIVAHGKLLNIEQDGNLFKFYPCTPEEFEIIWINYFDLNRDYGELKRILSENDEIMQKAITYADGIRILNQDFWECLVSFIISQRSNIKRISHNVEMLCQTYGEQINEYYCFPSYKTLENASPEDFEKCKVGYRAKYIYDAVLKANAEQIPDFAGLTPEEIKKHLLSINGVGEKVANCVMLFSCGVKKMFPIDVWVRRIMLYAYFKGQTVSDIEIEKTAIDMFGENAGFAQQYLFHYARTSDCYTDIKGEKIC